MVKGHCSFLDDCQWDETKRVKKFHLLMRDLAKRYVGAERPERNRMVLKSGRQAWGKRFHFHFAITSDNFDLTRTTPEVVCRYLTRQWHKIAKVKECVVEPWDPIEGPKGIWYMTQYDEKPLHHSRYFHGEFCHWKMSTLLHTKILRNANLKEAV